MADFSRRYRLTPAIVDVDSEFETFMALDRKTLAMCHSKDREQRYLRISLTSKAQRRRVDRRDLRPGSPYCYRLFLSRLELLGGRGLPALHRFYVADLVHALSHWWRIMVGRDEKS
jgi:hypothetical protein